MAKRRRKAARRSSGSIRRVAITPAVRTLDVFSFGMALGTAWGVGLLITTALSATFGYATPIIELISSGYIGLASTARGAIIGAIWGFIDGFVGGVVMAWLYNVFQRMRN